MSPNVIKIWATIIHFELSKIWSSITHEWSAIIYNHNYFIFSVNFSWFSPINFQINLKTFFAGDFLWIFAIFFQKLKIFLKGIWSHLQKIFKKNPQHKGKLMLSCDRRSFTIIDRIVSHDHSRSWSLGLKKYEPNSLMIGNDREWSPITFRSPYHWFVV